MKTESIVDYAMPCMTAETLLKKTHLAMLEKDYAKALEYAQEAAAECRLLAVTIKHVHMENSDAVRKQG
jgi:hypothetical protein